METTKKLNTIDQLKELVDDLGKRLFTEKMTEYKYHKVANQIDALRTTITTLRMLEDAYNNLNDNN